MKRIHPNVSAPGTQCSTLSNSCSDTNLPIAPAAVLTVWRKSLLFNCNGFTAFDSNGNLAYRVDSYSSGSGGEIVLMDAAGKPLFTSRRKKLNLSFGEQWLVFDEEGTRNPQFGVKKRSSMRQSKKLAHMKQYSTSFKQWTYEIEGSYVQLSCAMYGEGRQKLAEIRRKEAAANGAGFGTDVYRLVIYPGIDRTVAMVIAVLLDQMFGSRG